MMVIMCQMQGFGVVVVVILCWFFLAKVLVLISLLLSACRI